MENNNTCVYQHVRLDTNEVFYIGIGSDKRAYNKRDRNKLWKNIVNKTDYRVDILFDDLTWEEACEKEKEFIQLYGRRDLGLGTLVNMTDGGEGLPGRIVSEEHRIKMSQLYKGKKRGPMSDEHKEKLSEARKGKKLSQETRQKMSEDRKGKKRGPMSDEHKEKLSEILKGSKRSEETKLKMSEAQKGKKVSEETKLKMSIAAKNRKKLS